MKKVICTLPNASKNISGIDFVDIDGEMVAENVPDDDADHFNKVPGFKVIDEDGQSSLLDDDPKEPTNATDGLNYAELTVLKIKQMLEEDPVIYERVLADEVEARGDNARDGVIKACEDTKTKLQGGE